MTIYAFRDKFKHYLFYKNIFNKKSFKNYFTINVTYCFTAF